MADSIVASIDAAHFLLFIHEGIGAGGRPALSAISRAIRTLKIRSTRFSRVKTAEKKKMNH